uniref:BTB_2 domain-containing protein n=1 Tax=Globodera pallida TaxID=36090 RepID=A0A183C521_GLOPA
MTLITNFSMLNLTILSEFTMNIILNRGKTVEIDCEEFPFPCPPLSSPDDDLTVHIGDRQVTVSANWLMVVSPVVKRMLSVEMKEKQQRTLNLDGHDITMEQFMQFLETYLKRKCPNLKFLSLSGNPGWPHPILNDNLQLYRTYACCPQRALFG